MSRYYLRNMKKRFRYTNVRSYVLPSWCDTWNKRMNLKLVLFWFQPKSVKQKQRSTQLLLYKNNTQYLKANCVESLVSKCRAKRNAIWQLTVVVWLNCNFRMTPYENYNCVQISQITCLICNLQYFYLTNIPAKSKVNKKSQTTPTC